MSWISETCCNLLYSWGRISCGKFQERSAVAFSNDCSRWAGGISVRKVSDAAPPSTSRNSAFSSDVGLYVTTMFCLSIYLIVSPYVVCCACLLLARGEACCLDCFFSCLPAYVACLPVTLQCITC